MFWGQFKLHLQDLVENICIKFIKIIPKLFTDKWLKTGYIKTISHWDKTQGDFSMKIYKHSWHTYFVFPCCPFWMQKTFLQLINYKNEFPIQVQTILFLKTCKNLKSQWLDVLKCLVKHLKKKPTFTVTVWLAYKNTWHSEQKY